MGTGGIGGVHRGFADSLDISGDLPQIARTPAVVVSSGAKSILDVQATAELLETLGVPVLGWQTPTLPLFYSAGGRPAGVRGGASPAEAARIAARPLAAERVRRAAAGPAARAGLDLEADHRRGRRRVARARACTGQAVTPGRAGLVEELSDGRSVEVNQQLIADNAALAAEVAVAYAAAEGAAR